MRSGLEHVITCKHVGNTSHIVTAWLVALALEKLRSAYVRPCHTPLKADVNHASFLGNGPSGFNASGNAAGSSTAVVLTHHHHSAYNTPRICPAKDLGLLVHRSVE